MAKNIGTTAVLEDNAPPHQKIVTITNVTFSLFFFCLYCMMHETGEEKAKSDTLHTKMDWKTLLAPSII